MLSAFIPMYRAVIACDSGQDTWKF